jgi:hypothetical protein
MFFPTSTALLATTLLLSTTTSAAPTRTHCRCTVVADTPPAAIFSPSAAHWSPAELSPSTLTQDLCSNLGPQLEHFQRTAPDLYASYVSKPEDDNNNNVLVKFAAQSKRDQEPRPTERPHQRIVCRSESDPFTAYNGSFVTLWALQIVVAVAILACMVEGVHLCMRWYGAHDNRTLQHSVMRLPGSGLLLKISGATKSVEVRDEKKDWRHEATPMLIVQAPNGDRVCITYEEEDDDEANRPVM